MAEESMSLFLERQTLTLEDGACKRVPGDGLQRSCCSVMRALLNKGVVCASASSKPPAQKQKGIV